jgi:hypothetical protein
MRHFFPELRLLMAAFAWLLLLPPVASAETSTNAPIKDLGEGRLQIGLVTIDSKLKSLTFPALVNMTTGLVEYLLVTTGGKVHESLLRTDAEPFHIHTAMLLLGLKQATNAETTVFFDAKKQIPGAPVSIDVTVPMPVAGKYPIHNFLAFAESKRPVTTEDIPPWIYNGSRFAEGGLFLAQREGSIVSLIADPAALINNPRPDRENDELWTLHTQKIPPVGTPVQVTFRLLAQ